MYRLVWQEQPDEGRRRLRSHDEADFKGEYQRKERRSPLISPGDETLTLDWREHCTDNMKKTHKCEDLFPVEPVHTAEYDGVDYIEAEGVGDPFRKEFSLSDGIAAPSHHIWSEAEEMGDDRHVSCCWSRKENQSALQLDKISPIICKTLRGLDKAIMRSSQ